MVVWTQPRANGLNFARRFSNECLLIHHHWLDCARGLLGHGNCPYWEGTREALPINWCCPRCRRWSHGHRDWTKVCRQVRRSDAEHRPNRADNFDQREEKGMAKSKLMWAFTLIILFVSEATW